MANPTSFSFTDEFKERLEKLSKLVGKNKTQYMVEAVNAYATGNLPDTALLDRLDALAENDAELKKELGQIHDLLYQVLHNQQKEPD
jgi:predicted transcriptional regulator